MLERVNVARFEPTFHEDALDDLRRRLVTRAPGLCADGWELGVRSGWLDTLIGEWAAHQVDLLQRRLGGLEQPGGALASAGCRGLRPPTELEPASAAYGREVYRSKPTEQCKPSPTGGARTCHRRG